MDATKANTFWAERVEDVARALGSGPDGLDAGEAARRLAAGGPNAVDGEAPFSTLRLVIDQVKSPLILILAFAVAVSLVVGDYTDGAVVLAIMAVSAGIGFWRERGARTAIARLRARLAIETQVVRGGARGRIRAADVVPGDVMLLSAGTLVPADALVWEAADLHVNEAILTGETFPTEKRPGVLPAPTPLAARSNCVFAGTNVRTGTARALVVATGASTAYGQIAGRLKLRPPETEFDRGVRQFGTLLAAAMTALVVVVFAINVLYARPIVEALLFSIALAVGLSPELLPAILSVTLARSAQVLAGRGVLVRRLAAIENLGSMDVLCTDKTGTLTEGVVSVEGAYDADGHPSAAVLAIAVRNARLETGLDNPIDEALLRGAPPDAGADGEGDGEGKIAEIPYDFVRKRLSVVVRSGAGARLLTKGAVEPLVAVCTRTADGSALDEPSRARIRDSFRAFSEDGLRVLAVATRTMPLAAHYGRDDERDMTFEGFVVFTDPPKPGAAGALADLAALGVGVKMITGDNRLVAAHVAREVQLDGGSLLTGAQLDELHDEALWAIAERTAVFAEVDPNQKERLILALKKTGHVVGFMGDGVNDAPAMHAADTSISVEGAADVARDAADFVLLERDLDVVRRGVVLGRATFANTLKYIETTLSANLGNMISMAAASLFLPFLPLLASQILLNNFLSDLPAFGLASDAVDPELVARPRRWDVRAIRRFMIQFGLLSSLFDFATFAVLLLAYRAAPVEFRTAWFIESLLTELAIALVVRTRRICTRSRPGAFLLWSTIATAAVTFALPYSPLAPALGFQPLPAVLLAIIVAVTAGYVVAAELLKQLLFRGSPGRPGGPERAHDLRRTAAPAQSVRESAEGRAWLRWARTLLCPRG
jgi:Mg2+-importing ATPase